MLRKLIYIALFFSFSAFSQDEKLEKIYQHLREVYSSGNLDSATMLSAQLFEKAKEKGSVIYEAKADLYSALSSADRNRYKEAFERYFEALKKCRKTADTNLQAIILEDIGSLYNDQKNFAEAEKYFEEVIALKTIKGDSVRLANTLMNVSMLQRRGNGAKKAQLLLNRVRRIAFAQKDEMLLANYYNNQAAHYLFVFIDTNRINAYGNDPHLWDRNFVLKNLRDSTEIYFNKALLIWKKMKRPDLALQPLFNLAFVAQSKKDQVTAIKNYREALRLADSLNLTRKKITLFGNLGESYYDAGNYKDAADFFRKHIELKDSVQRAEIKAYSIKLSRQYELETNKTILEQELELSRKNEKINQQEKQIYRFLFLLILLLFIVAGTILYINFNKRVAKKIEEAKEKFFSNIMHEIRTPLSMIQAPLKTLRPKVTDEEGIYYLQLAEKNAVRLNELINQMLDLSKIENSAYKLNKTVGNIDDLFRNLLGNYEKIALEKNIHFVTELNYSGGLLLYDRDALEKIIGNLLSNAIKYTPENGTVGLSAELVENEHKCVLMADVWDTGIGIPKSDQEKIFTRFFRSGKSSAKAQGLGIGLSLVKDLVAACKGKISFQSEIDKGTKFSLEIPLENAEVATGTQNTDHLPDGKPVVLLVEDDDDILNFNASFLSGKDLQVIKAPNALVAKTLLKNITPDLIVTDLMMDGLDGLSFIKDIKSNKGLNHIPVIVLSAKSAGQTRVETLDAGAQAFVSKPFLPEELYSIISNQLELITRIKKELKSNIEMPKKDVPAEKKFSSTEPYTQKLFDLIFKQLDNSDLSVEMLADLMATNRSHFQRKIKSLTGYSPSELIKMIRLEKSKEFLLARKGNITEVAYMCGFSSQSYFTRCFTQHFGFSPTQIFSQPAS